MTGTFALVFLFDTRVDADTLETEPLAASSAMPCGCGRKAYRKPGRNRGQKPGEAGLR
jgi:hypothetical protein